MCKYRSSSYENEYILIITGGLASHGLIMSPLILNPAHYQLPFENQNTDRITVTLETIYSRKLPQNCAKIEHRNLGTKV